MVLKKLSLFLAVTLISRNCVSSTICDKRKGCCSGYKWDVIKGKCIKCPNGYFGFSCENACPFPYYGEKCLQTCICNRSECDISYGCERFLSSSESLKMVQTEPNEERSPEPFVGLLFSRLENVSDFPWTRIPVASVPNTRDNLLLTSILFVMGSVLLLVTLPIVLYCVLRKRKTLYRKNDLSLQDVIRKTKSDAQQSTNEYETLGYEILFQGFGNLSIFYNRKRESYSINISSRDICVKKKNLIR